ncbi:MAG: hypothetical protein ACYCZH_03720 [Sulfuriferula sp.]
MDVAQPQQDVNSTTFTTPALLRHPAPQSQSLSLQLRVGAPRKTARGPGTCRSRSTHNCWRAAQERCCYLVLARVDVRLIAGFHLYQLDGDFLVHCASGVINVGNGFKIVLQAAKLAPGRHDIRNGKGGNEGAQ